MRKILACCVLLFSAIACNLSATPATQPAIGIAVTPACNPDQAIQIDSNGKTISLKKDTVLGVELESNPTTGYEWLVDELDSAKLASIGSEYVRMGNAPGSGGASVLCFRALSPGSTHLHLVYRRPWESKTTPDPYAPPDFEIDISITE